MDFIDSVKLYRGDCLDIMRQIPDKSVDMVLTDPPYGTTACKWDSVIPFEPMWAELKRIRKERAAVVLFGSEPFSSRLRLSNIKEFKYDWIWDKKIPSGVSYARYRPMQQSELVSVFGRGKISYYPQMIPRSQPIKSGGTKKSDSAPIAYKDSGFKKMYCFKNPATLIEFLKVRRGAVHPTQKPVALLEYLIKTYTLEGETVLDFTMGSGSTGVACVNTGRRFIGIEKDTEYFKIAEKRIAEAK